MRRKNPLVYRQGMATICLSFAVLCILNALPALAAPYNGEKTYTYHQPDGSTFSVKLYGDEFFAYQRTLDGLEVVLDRKTGTYCYAVKAADGKSFVSSGIPVTAAKTASLAANQAAAQAAGAAPMQTLSTDAVIARVKKAQAAFRVDDRGRPLAANAAPSAATTSSGPYPAPPSRTTTGDYIGLCILVDFPDQPGAITQAQVDAYCNQPTGYTEFGNACSINEYYSIQSNGTLNFTNTVTAYVRMPHPKTYYDDNSALNWGTSKAQELVAAALDILIADGFDFTTLTTDASNYITSINVFYAGTCASGWNSGLWPHSWAIPAKLVDATNGIYAYRYQMTDMESSLSIGTFCHENGHMTCLFPDLYSYSNSASIVGKFSLMCQSGSTHPPSIDAYLKYKAGWADVVETDSSTLVRATVQADRNYFYKYTNPAESREYFLVENRNNSGYEGPYGGSASSTAPGLGLAVWHVFEGGSNTYCSIQTSSNYTVPYELFVVEATPTTSYSPWYANPSPYPGTTDTYHDTQGADPLSDSTQPNLNFWDHSGDSGLTEPSGLVLHSYTVPGPAVSFTIGAGDPPATPEIGLTASSIADTCNLGDSPENHSFSVFNAGGGTLDYSITHNETWLTCTPSSGSLTTAPQTITVSFDTSALASGTHSDTLTVSATGASNSPQTISVSITIAQAAVISLSTSALSDTLFPGQASYSKNFSISNTGGGNMSYTVNKTATWLTPSLSSGTCSTETDVVYLTLDATGLTAGTYDDTVSVTSTQATNSPQTVQVTLTVEDGLIVTSPNGGEIWVAGDPQTIAWTASMATDVKIELLKGGALEREIDPAAANDGSYEWTLPGDLVEGGDYRIRITTTDDAFTDESDADFSIWHAIYSANMNSDPGWTLEGLWAWGVPLGLGGDDGQPDPTEGYTGTNVIGYNLSGDYENNLVRKYATTPAIDCTAYENVTLSFMRWLGVEDNLYDYAGVEASNDGTNWTTLWENTVALNAGSWVAVEYDLSTVADASETVWIRWYMGATDDSWQYCGWNIDDVIVMGDVRQFTIDFQTDGTAGASLEGQTSQTVSYGEDCTAVTAVPPSGYVFSHWEVASVEVSTDNPLTVTSVTESLTYTAVFVLPTPAASLSSSTYSGSEGAGAVTITVNLDLAPATSCSIGYATSDGTALADTDYTATTGTLTINAPNTSGTFDIPILDDGSFDESEETFTVTLSTPVDCTLGTPDSASITITDNDATGTLATVYVNFDWTGGEQGSAQYPYNTFAEGLTAVAPAGTIYLDGSASDLESGWTGVINTAMTINLSPSGSPVRIGVTGASSAASSSDGTLDSLLHLLAAINAGPAKGKTGQDKAGTSGIVLNGTTYEPVFPFTRKGDTLTAGIDSVLAIRLRGDQPLDPAAIWTATTEREDGLTVQWQPVNDLPTTDLWVLVSPSTTWKFKETISAEAGADTVTGGRAQSPPYDFEVESKEAYEQRIQEETGAIWQPIPGKDYTSGTPAPARSEHSVTVDPYFTTEPTPNPGEETFLIGPEQVYDVPQRVWIPIPHDIEPVHARLYYYHPYGSDRGWYPAENVAGWMEPGSTLYVQIEGVTYLGFLVNHAGIVQIGAEEQ